MGTITEETKLIDLNNLATYDKKIKEYIKSFLAESATHSHNNLEVLDKLTEELYVKLLELQIDSELSEISTNPVENKIITEALKKKVNNTLTINGKALLDNINLTASDVGADIQGSASNALTQSKQYTDSEVSSAKTYTDTKIADLVDSAPETLNTLGELANALKENSDIVEVLDEAISNKADKTDLNNHVNNASIHVTSTEKQQIANHETNITNILNGTTTVGSSTKLSNKRNFSIVGGAVSDVVSFDGTDNVQLNVTSLDAMKLAIASGNTLILNGDSL